MIIAGIDYSINGPAMTIHTGESFDHSNTVTYFLTSIKKYQQTFCNSRFIGSLLPENYSSQEQRVDKISDYFIDIILSHNVTHVAIEDYAFAAKGRVFHIAENTGLLKHKIYKHDINIDTFTPGQIKNHAGNKGNCGKQEMNDAFTSETSIDLSKLLEYNKKTIDSPIADIVDSYYTCKLLHTTLTKN